MAGSVWETEVNGSLSDALFSIHPLVPVFLNELCVYFLFCFVCMLSYVKCFNKREVFRVVGTAATILSS